MTRCAVSLVLCAWLVAMAGALTADNDLVGTPPVLSATLTMAGSPSEGGSTGPAYGASSVTVGKPVDITATPVDGYTFSSWTVTGVGRIFDSSAAATTVYLYGNATITAVFERMSIMATLVMEVSPVDTGTTDPTVGQHSVVIGSSYAIEAVPGDGFIFVAWNKEGGAAIDNPASQKTSVTLSSDATVTAVFARMVVPATLTMAVSPDGAGTTDPATGAHVVQTQDAIAIKASPSGTYLFVRWIVSGLGTVDDSTRMETTVTLSGDATVTAQFAKSIETDWIVMTVWPRDVYSGTTTPTPGDHLVRIGETIDITAEPAEGYFFNHWDTLLGKVVIENPLLPKTRATISGGDIIEAGFQKIVATGTLTMAVSPGGAGTTNPSVGAHVLPIGTTVGIAADPGSGYYFERWEVVGGCVIGNPYSPDTIATLNADATITAVFAKVVTTAALTMAVSPDGAGSTNPGVGSHIVQAGSRTAIEAAPAEGKIFFGWRVKGGAVVDEPWFASTMVTVDSDATVTALFANVVTTAALTMAVSPDGTGTTFPAMGAHVVPTQVEVEINADAIDDYFFSSWSAAGTVKLRDSSSAHTTATLSGDATVTANFVKVVASATLTMAVSPGGSGATNPGAGAHVVPTGASTAIEAFPTSDFFFSSWSVSGQGTVAEPSMSATTATLSGDATVTANFVKIAATATLTMAVSPGGSGATNPGEGAHVVPVGAATAIEAFPTSDFFFSSWSVSGQGTVAEPSMSATTVTLSGDAAVTANFVKVVASATLTMAVSPAASGSTTPSEGAHTVPTMVEVAIEAFAADDFFFSSWNVSGAGTLRDSLSPSTTVTLSGDATVTADFVKMSSTATLTMAVSPPGSGSTSPEAGAHVVPFGVATEIKAVPADGYYFSIWIVDGKGVITDPPSSATRISLSGDATATAVFAKVVDAVTLIMAVAPGGTGSTSPAAGAHVVQAGAATRIEALSGGVYFFSSWSATGQGVVADPSSPMTTATLSGDATVTANFVKVSSTAALTMAISPDGTGSTNPGTGTHTVPTATTVTIEALPASGYFFSSWMVSGQGKVADPSSPATTISLVGDATATANFVKISSTATLTMAVGAEGGGSTNPGVGSHIVATGIATSIMGIPAEGYFFVSWSMSGNGWIDNSLSAETTATLSGDAAVTATFAKWVGTAQLTMAVSSSGFGYTIPAVGVHVEPIGSVIPLEAVSGDGSCFKGWTLVGEGLIGNPASPSTTVKLYGDATATAIFEKADMVATLTMAVSPDGTGSVNPGVGEHTVPVGEGVAVEAIPAVGFLFEKWDASDAVEIDNAHSSSATVRLSADGTLTARFMAETNRVVLTMAVSPDGSGTTVPTVGTYSVFSISPVDIAVFPSSGWHFAGWAASANAIIIDPSSLETTVILHGDATITAVFDGSSVDFLAVGSTTQICADEIGDGAVTTFTQKPSIWAEYTDPVSGKAGKKTSLSVLTKIGKSSPVEMIDVEWTKKLLLYSKSSYRAKSSPLSEQLIARPVPSLLTDALMAKSPQFGKNVNIVDGRSVVLSSPSVSLVRGAPQKTGDTFVVEGMYFGAKPPMILMEYKKTTASGTDTYLYVKCGIVKAETLLYSDAKGKPNASCMKIRADETLRAGFTEPVGFSLVAVKYPGSVKNATATGYLIVDNGIGLAAFPMAIERN